MIKVNVCLGRGKGLGQREWGTEREVQGVHVAGVSIVAAGCVGYPHFVIDISSVGQPSDFISLF